jgi:hypothetical protein
MGSMNLFKRMAARIKARKEYSAKHAEFDRRIEQARSAHKRVKPIMEEREQFVLDKLRGQVTNDDVRRILEGKRHG